MTEPTRRPCHEYCTTTCDAPTGAHWAPTAEQWLAAVVNISRQIANLEALPAVLQSIVSVATELVCADAAAITLLSHDQTQLILKCFASRSDQIEAQKGCDTLDASIVRRAIREGRALCYPQDRLPSEAAWHCPRLGVPVRAASVVPLQFGGTAVGSLTVVRHANAAFTQADVLGLTHLASQAVIALEHANMASRIQSVAIVEERNRIAREMHDSLAQVLGYLNVQMQTLQMLVQSGSQQRLVDELTTTRQSIRRAQDDVRDSILSLRTTLSDDLPLYDALQEYTLEFGAQTGLDVYFHSNTTASPPISPLANVEVVRIIQEALTNVRKHAQANTVNVTLKLSPRWLEVTITDDGIGFDPGHTLPGHFGLYTMAERARQVDGTLQLESEPGAGTTVRLKVPLMLPA